MNFCEKSYPLSNNVNLNITQVFVLFNPHSSILK